MRSQRCVESLAQSLGWRRRGSEDLQYQRHVAPIFLAAQCPVDYTQTTRRGRRGEAINIAENLEINANDAVVICS